MLGRIRPSGFTWLAVSPLPALSLTRVPRPAQISPAFKKSGITILAIMLVAGLAVLCIPDIAFAQQGQSVWQSLNNVNTNAQSTLLKAMVTVGILMLIVGAWMYKQEKGGAIPVLILGLVLIVVGGLTASTVLQGIGATGSSGF